MQRSGETLHVYFVTHGRDEALWRRKGETVSLLTFFLYLSVITPKEIVLL